MGKRVLVVEDEEDIRESLAYSLRAEGYGVEVTGLGEDALARIEGRAPDIVLLDLMLPDISGLEVCRRIRRGDAASHLPVIIVTAKGAEVDRIVGLELGADDYVVKPFSVREVVLRVRAVLARATVPAAAETGGVIEQGSLRIDMERHEVVVDGAPCVLTATEYRLLYQLASRPGRVQSRDVLLDAVWGSERFVTPRTVDTHVRRLREKLGVAGALIETLRGVGYRFQGMAER